MSKYRFNVELDEDQKELLDRVKLATGELSNRGVFVALLAKEDKTKPVLVKARPRKPLPKFGAKA